MASSERDIPDLITRLTETLQNFTNRPGTQEKTRKRLAGLQRRIGADGPTSYTVARIASHTRDSVPEFLNMTGTDWNWTNPPPGHASRSNTLNAEHIFDASAVVEIGEDWQLIKDLKNLNIERILVTEATMEEAFHDAGVRSGQIKKWAKVVETGDITDMRLVEAIRTDLHRGPTKYSYESMRFLSDAESIALALRRARAGTPVRLVTENQGSGTWHRRFGLVSTSMWSLFAEAIQNNTLPRREIPRLRWLRAKHDPTFSQDSPDSWPKAPDSPPPSSNTQAKPPNALHRTLSPKVKNPRN